MSDPQIVVRIFVAALACSMLGLERSRRYQFIGARTFGLIGIGGAVAGAMSTRLGILDPAATSRTLQGMLAGIGFLGAGVIVHPGARLRTVGVTTAAAIWVAAVLGFAAGIGEWLLVIAGAAFSLVLLIMPEPLASKEDRERARREAETQ